MNAHEVPASTKFSIPKNMQRCPIIGVNFCVSDRYDVVKMVLTELKNLAGEYICFYCVHQAVMAKENPALRDILNEAILTLPESQRDGLVEILLLISNS